MRKTPQEKKRLSYAKDRRNTYGENDKASRKNIPRSRARVHRANRHFDAQALGGSTGAVDPDLADRVEQRVLNQRRRAFRKSPDTPLGEYLAERAAWAEAVRPPAARRVRSATEVRP
ncbi:hypothetical protein AB0H76_04590 [Nocardia sp. NPDC050712]|uniref:hypothetical protein n=1 Tax=Nocardia sp. NPDC050712 TaxID=3155518 RepID=UPI0033D4385A